MPSGTKPQITIATNDPCSPTASMEDAHLSSLSPASLSTTLSSAAYYSTPQGDNAMDISDEETHSPLDSVLIKPESSPNAQLDDIEGYQDATAMISPDISSKKKPGRPPKSKQAGKDSSRKARGLNERSKTGCLTCRKRKKKCDETKPKCNNCTKTNYECEGYQPTRFWQSSASRLKRQNSQSDDMKKLLILPPQPRANLFPAIENELDMSLLEHFTDRTSRILTPQELPDENPWITLLFPMAKENSCLMHSVLALSGAHWAKYNYNDTRRDCVTRQFEHAQKALQIIREQLSQAEETGQLSRPIIAALMINCLIPIVDGTTGGEYRIHLSIVKNYIDCNDDTEFSRFAWEFYKHYEFCRTLTSLPDTEERPESHLEYFERRPSNPSSPVAGLMLSSMGVRVGVLNGEFLRLVSDITRLRDRVRQRHAMGQRPAVDPMTFASAERLDRSLWGWESGHKEGTAQYVAAKLYKHACLCYLSRTIRGARDLEDHVKRIDYGLKCLETLPPKDPTQCTVLLPTFLLGCAAFRVEHREKIKRALNVLEDYNQMGNIKPTREVLERVWELMDTQDESNWDWETIMREMNYDILIN